MIKERDLIEQAKNGVGERLAKPLTNQPVLVNNHLLFSMPGNAALGVAMTVGSINKTVNLFDELDMEPMDLVKIMQVQLGTTSLPDDTVTYEPYCYLDGYPAAFLQARILITSGNEVDTLTWRSERAPIEGENSWSEANGSLLIEKCTGGIRLLSSQLVNLSESK